MKLSLHLGLFLSICATLAYPQDFYRVPNLNALVVLKSRAEFNPNGVSNVTRLVVRDIPFLQQCFQY